MEESNPSEEPREDDRNEELDESPVPDPEDTDDTDAEADTGFSEAGAD